MKKAKVKIRRELNGVVTTLNERHVVAKREFGVAENWCVATTGHSARVRERGQIEAIGGPGVDHIRILSDECLDIPIERWREFVAKIERRIADTKESSK